MTRSTMTIPFHNLTFMDDITNLRDIEERWKRFLKQYRREAQEADLAEGKITDEDLVPPYDLLDETDRRRIKRRAMRLLERAHSKTGMYHLSEENCARLTPLRGGSRVAKITTEHEADEIAAALHAEMPWMAQATEAVWHGLRASALEGLLGVRFNPLVLVGSPGIVKSFWARRLASHLAVPTTKVEPTGEPSAFSIVGLQKGWGSASPRKLVQTVLRDRHAGPLMIVDEVGKADEVYSNKGSRHTLTDALLPLLEQMAARQ